MAVSRPASTPRSIGRTGPGRPVEQRVQQPRLAADAPARRRRRRGRARPPWRASSPTPTSGASTIRASSTADEDVHEDGHAAWRGIASRGVLRSERRTMPRPAWDSPQAIAEGQQQRGEHERPRRRGRARRPGRAATGGRPARPSRRRPARLRGRGSGRRRARGPGRQPDQADRERRGTGQPTRAAPPDRCAAPSAPGRACEQGDHVPTLASPSAGRGRTRRRHPGISGASGRSGQALRRLAGTGSTRPLTRRGRATRSRRSAGTTRTTSAGSVAAGVYCCCGGPGGRKAPCP